MFDTVQTFAVILEAGVVDLPLVCAVVLLIVSLLSDRTELWMTFEGGLTEQF